MSAEPGRVTWHGSNPNGSAVAARSFSFVSVLGALGNVGNVGNVIASLVRLKVEYFMRHD